jgi:RNA polymerase sigma-70 factor, ECF subfamily
MASAPNQMFSDPLVDFEGVASRYSPVLFRVALKRLRNVEDAEDAVQDALLSAYKHIDQFEGRSQLSSWLTKIVTNAAGMKLRSRGRQEGVVSLDQSAEEGGTALANELVCRGPNPETICLQTEMEEMLHGALDHMSPKLRSAFEMREMSELSTKETADALGITTSSLKSRVKRARAAVASYFVQGSRRRPAVRLKEPVVDRTTDSFQVRTVQSRRRRLATRRREFPRRAMPSHGHVVAFGGAI